MGVARCRARAETIRLRRRAVRGRAASRDRHRGSDGLGRPVGHERGRRLRGATAATRVVSDGSDCGRLVGDARPPGLDRGDRGNPGRRGRRRGHDRPERRARGNGAVRLPGHPPHRGPERLRRPRDASASPTAAGAATPGAATAAGAGCGSARSRAARGSITPRAPSVRGAGTGPSGGSIRGEAASCGPEAGKHGDDSSYPWCASTECSTSASSSPWSCSCLSRSDSREPDASARTAGAPRRSGPAPSSRRDDARGSRRAGAADAFEAAAPGPSRRGRPRARGARRRRPATSPAPCRAPIRAGAPP